MLYEKECKRCKKTKPIKMFYLIKNKKGMRVPQYMCKKCRLEYQKEWILKQGENFRKISDLKSNYGINKEDYFSILDSQKGKCGICRVELNFTLTHLDHHHKTGKIRGILCHQCNVGLGMFKEKEEYLIKAIQYLKSGGSHNVPNRYVKSR